MSADLHRWNESFDLYLYDDPELEITVWDKDQRSKDDFMGRSVNKQHEA
jgi:hypothetical protein